MSFSFCFRTVRVLSGSSNRHSGDIRTRLHSSRCLSPSASEVQNLHAERSSNAHPN